MFSFSFILLSIINHHLKKRIFSINSHLSSCYQRKEIDICQLSLNNTKYSTSPYFHREGNLFQKQKQ